MPTATPRNGPGPSELSYVPTLWDHPVRLAPEAQGSTGHGTHIHALFFPRTSRVLASLFLEKPKQCQEFFTSRAPGLRIFLPQSPAASHCRRRGGGRGEGRQGCRPAGRLAVPASGPGGRLTGLLSGHAHAPCAPKDTRAEAEMERAHGRTMLPHGNQLFLSEESGNKVGGQRAGARAECVLPHGCGQDPERDAARDQAGGPWTALCGGGTASGGPSARTPSPLRALWLRSRDETVSGTPGFRGGSAGAGWPTGTWRGSGQMRGERTSPAVPAGPELVQSPAWTWPS